MTVVLILISKLTRVIEFVDTFRTLILNAKTGTDKRG